MIHPNLRTDIHVTPQKQIRDLFSCKGVQMLHTLNNIHSLLPFMTLIFLLFSGCQDKNTDSEQASDIQISTCSSPLPAVAWSESSMPIEGESGIREELESLDLTLLSDPVDISALLPLFRGAIAYALEISPQDLPNQLMHEQAYDAGILGKVVLGSLLLGQEDPTGMDFAFFRRGLHEYYTCSKGFPLTLEDFHIRYGSYTSTAGITIDSIAKCNERKIITPYPNVYIAESLVDGVVRETEILLQTERNDGQLDFLVYDAQGMLTNRTQFPTINNGPHIVTSSPYSCMACHLNPDSAENTWGYDLIVPETGPCR